MSVTSSPPQTTPAVAGASAPPAIAGTDIDASCRLPLVVLFLSAATWLLVGSAFDLIASIKFHAPGFLADSAWLTYGRVRPASANCLLYGFCMQAGLGVALWMLARLGRTALARPALVIVGAVCWNFGVTLGVGGILAGGSTGFENLEMPAYAARLLLLGYLMISLWAVLTFHQRRDRQAYVSQWFIFAALFWFPWVYSTANLLLLAFRVRGIAQAVIAWWYSANLLVVWFGLVGLAAVFYFVPKLTNRELHSRYLALLTFWMLILFGSWSGVPPECARARVAACLERGRYHAGIRDDRGSRANRARHSGRKVFPSHVSPVSAIHGLRHGRLYRRGLAQRGKRIPRDRAGDTVHLVHPCHRPAQQLRLLRDGNVRRSLLHRATTHGLGVSVTRTRAGAFLDCRRWSRVVRGPAGHRRILQGLRLQHADIPFSDIANGTLPFLRASTTGDLLMALGHLMFLANLGGLVVRFYRARAVSAWADATTEIKMAEARP